MALSELDIFSNFAYHIFWTFGVEGIIITQRYEVLCWLSSDLEMIDLE